jgi:ParB family transcriptional regulator, chromosome partitioning protein
VAQSFGRRFAAKNHRANRGKPRAALAIMRAPMKSKAPDLLDMGNLDLFESKDIPKSACAALVGEPLQVPIHCLDQDPNNPRTEFPQQDIDDLARDIALRGILQPIVASVTTEPGKYLIRFGNKRWRAAKQAGLREVPVTVTAQARDAYDQVAENMKRHALSPLDLARFIRKQIDGGESNATVAKRLGIDQTTVAHHLALLALPPVLDAAIKAGRCSSPRTLYELNKLHAAQPGRVADLVASGEPITREAVAEIRDAAPALSAALRATTLAPPRPNEPAQLLARAKVLCARLDAALVRLSQTDTTSMAAGAMTELRQQILAIASRLDR